MHYNPTAYLFKNPAKPYYSAPDVLFRISQDLVSQGDGRGEFAKIISAVRGSNRIGNPGLWALSAGFFPTAPYYGLVGRHSQRVPVHTAGRVKDAPAIGTLGPRLSQGMPAVFLYTVFCILRRQWPQKMVWKR